MNCSDKKFNFKKYDQKQHFLLPPSLDEWIPKDHVTRFISTIIEELNTNDDLKIFYQHYRKGGQGAWAYHPKMLLKVLIYGYSEGITSSRKLAQAVENQITFRYLSANQLPDFRTICRFRRQNLEAFKGLFLLVLELCNDAGLTKMKAIALDGRKVKANASLEKNRSRRNLVKQISKLLNEAEEIDQLEDEEYGEDNKGYGVPEKYQDPKEQKRLVRSVFKNIKNMDASMQDKILRCVDAYYQIDDKEQSLIDVQKQKLDLRAQEEQIQKKRGRKPKSVEDVKIPDAKGNMTDPDSRILKTRKGWLQGYNCQAISDCESQVIVACDVTQDENDRHQLLRMVAMLLRKPKVVLADAGYWSEDAVTTLSKDVDVLIAPNKSWKLRNELRKKGPPRGRTPANLSVKELMIRKLQTKHGRRLYRKRSPAIEGVFGQMHMRDHREFRLRGHSKVKGEWTLWCITHNLLKLFKSQL